MAKHKLDQLRELKEKYALQINHETGEMRILDKKTKQTYPIMKDKDTKTISCVDKKTNKEVVSKAVIQDLMFISSWERNWCSAGMSDQPFDYDKKHLNKELIKLALIEYAYSDQAKKVYDGLISVMSKHLKDGIEYISIANEVASEVPFQYTNSIIWQLFAPRRLLKQNEWWETFRDGIITSGEAKEDDILYGTISYIMAEATRYKNSQQPGD
ncbi:MAG: hypothetical protein IJ542_01695 [Clostridia bacterium]|nr:hypothetical protein [Clostridia bacterium]